jgi:FkbH-like protein
MVKEARQFHLRSAVLLRILEASSLLRAAMYEIDKYVRPPHSPLRLGNPYAHLPAAEIDALSFLFWGEHCIECAAPACFQSCDLYQARPDGRCRRFTWGIGRTSAFPSLRGYGVEVSFKKWGKLETRGNTGMARRGRLLAFERLLGWAAPVLNWIGAGMARILRRRQWRELTVHAYEKLGRTLHRRMRHDRAPDAFLLEVYNPADVDVRLQISMGIARNDIGRRLNAETMLPSFRKSIRLTPGYSRHEIARNEFSAVTESGLPFDIALIPEADSGPTLVFLTSDFVCYALRQHSATPSTSNLPGVKCVVWDLDNTLWDGVLLENDVVRLNRSALDLLKAFDDRGILASVASKNDFALAYRKLIDFGIAEYMLFPQINWLPKSEGIKIIAEKLNIGLDTFVFIDDNPFELAEVSQTLPMVMCVQSADIARLLDDPRFAGSTSAEAKRRRSMYREAMVREEEQRKFGEDFFGFLRTCDIKLRIMPYAPEFFDRLSELVQRTNQLNFSGRKYKRHEIESLLTDERLEIWLLDCSDKFGSYGVVGCGIVSRGADEVRIEDFMLSCRVQGKFVEQAFFNAMVDGDTSKRLWVNFRATGRNTPAQQCLSTIGFEVSPNEVGMVLDPRKRALSCDFITVEMVLTEKGSARPSIPRELAGGHSMTGSG